MNKLASKLEDRLIKVSLLNDAELDTTMHGKPKLPFQASEDPSSLSSKIPAPSSGSNSQGLEDDLTHVGQPAAARALGVKAVMKAIKAMKAMKAMKSMKVMKAM